ncbi:MULTISPECIES: MarR family winged helix-turn-helix transcriptional regulator [Shewanella]|uniref:Winged helix-turn-helix transcriptional regulator n=1 Tax=Shewanella polaris TaxID=2588449 RepID=A0A4Y5YFM4_9GAMM|nr:MULTISPECIES: MarR family winged helix-turn-helix transcriptional regulator [Shewanella]QDE31590.1 winged helix-turn-helix transcriptional regulator [Shewanella polaris]
MSENIKEPLFNLLHSVKRSLRQAIDSEGFGLTPLHMRVLKLIASQDKEYTANDIVQKTLIDKAQLARLIKELIQLEYVVKINNPHDKRSYFLGLSPAGSDVVTVLSAAESRVNEIMKSGLTDQEIADFSRLAKLMAKNLNRHL